MFIKFHKKFAENVEGSEYLEIWESFDKLTEAQHRRVIVLATAWAAYKLGLPQYRHFQRDERLALQEAELVSEALFRTLNGRRRWNRAKGDLVHHMFQTIDSLISNEIRSQAFKDRVRAVRAEREAADREALWRALHGTWGRQKMVS